MDPLSHVFLIRLSYRLSVACSLVVSCWERADLLAVLYVMFSSVLSLSYIVSWVMGGT